MSEEENSEVVHRTVALYNEGDLERFMNDIHPEVVWEENHPTFGFVGLDPAYEGHDGMRRWWQVTREMWETVELDVNAISPAGDDRLVVHLTLHGTGAGSGVDVEMNFFHVMDFRDGKMLRRRIYPGRAEALEAAGLSE